MASFGIVHHFEGGTQEQYDNAVKVVHPAEGLPPGQTLHLAGKTADGWLVVALWDSEDDWVEFRDNTLLPGLHSAAGAFGGPPTETTFEITTEQSG